MEDLISTGGSVITAVEALREAGCEVLGAVAIFTYELERGYKQLEDADIKAFALSDYSSLIEVALEKGLVNEAELEKLREWRKNPEDKSWVKL